MITAFWVEGKPATQGNHRVGRHGKLYEGDGGKMVAWRSQVMLRARETGVQYHGPVAVSIVFHLPRPLREWSARGGLRPSAAVHHAKKPDLDKLVRAIFDALTIARMIEDDARICRLAAEKIPAPDDPGVQILIEPMGQAATWERVR